jgi:SAM-dependent methyltransferase
MRAMAAATGSWTLHASAEAYERHVGRYGPELAAAMIQLARIERGQRALDVGCGPGALATALVELLGADAVAAVDPSEPFVEICRSRAPGADVRVGRAEELPFGDDAFDAVLAQLVVQRLSDAPQGVREMGRVARPGGVVAACVWDFASGMTMLRTFWDAAVAIDPAGARRFGAGSPMPYCTPGELRELWRGAGLADVQVGELLVGADYAGFDDFWSSFSGGVGGSSAYCASLDERCRSALREDIWRRLGAPEGAFRLTARAWYARGLAR